MRRSHGGFINARIVERAFLCTLIVIAGLIVGSCGSSPGVNAAERTEAIEAVRQPQEIEVTELLSEIPEYSGEAYIAVNDNIPFFTKTGLTTESIPIWMSLGVAELLVLMWGGISCPQRSAEISDRSGLLAGRL